MANRNTSLGGTDWQDSGTTSLNGSINDTITTITVDDTTSFKSSGYIFIGDELISYTGKTGTTFTGCSRGVGIDGSDSHSDNSTVNEKEVLTSTDINDTFDAAFSKIQTLSTFWLNSDLYDVYDNFNSYITGSFSTNTKWTISLVNGGTSTISATTNAGGSTKELKLYASANTSTEVSATATTKTLVANRHTHVKVYASSNSSSSAEIMKVEVEFGNTGTYHVFHDVSLNKGGSTRACIMIINTGDGDYDLYFGGKLYASYSSISSSNAQLSIRVRADNNGSGTGTATVYIDDVVQSGSDVN